MRKGKKSIMILTRANFFWTIAVVALTLLGGAGCQPFSFGYKFKGTQFDTPIPVPNFELVDSNNQPFHLKDVAGNVALVFFGYTFCPDVCPLTLVDVKTAMNKLEGKEKVKVIFITVDPDRDTPEAMRGYLDNFDPEYIGLTGDYEQIQQVMKPFGAFAQKEEVSESAAGYLVSHTARLYLINPNQELILTYPFGFEADDLRSDLTHLLQQ